MTAKRKVFISCMRFVYYVFFSTEMITLVLEDFTQLTSFVEWGKTAAIVYVCYTISCVKTQNEVFF